MTIVPRGRLAPVAETGEPEPATARPRLQTVVALVVLALCGLLAWQRLERWERLQDELVARARAVGLDGKALADAARDARREVDPANAKIEMARALLDRELLFSELEGAASLERLALARALAGEALARQPANHEAAMIVGATLALERSRTRDTRLFSLSREWEAPLEAAAALAPGSERPRRLLAAAYLEVWPALSPAKREIATGLLREAFRDRDTFERLFAPWVAIAGSLDRAAELLPDEPRSWLRLAEAARARGSWRELAALTGRHRAALERTFSAELAPAGAGSGATPRPDFFAEVLDQAPLDAAFTPLVERALAVRPPGPAGAVEARAAQRWFQWAAPLCLLRDCPLPGPALERLASLAGGLLAPEQGAFAALVAGDEPRAALFERRAEALWSEPWAPYLTLKARHAAERREIAAARDALGLAHRAFRPRAAWRIAAAAAGFVDLSAPASTPPLDRDLWEAADWWFSRGATRLDLVPSRAAGGLQIQPDKVPGKGALLEIVWDGRRLEPLEIPAGTSETTFRVAFDSGGVSPEPHLLEIRVLGGDLRPAMRVRLDAPAPRTAASRAP